MVYCFEWYFAYERLCLSYFFFFNYNSSTFCNTFIEKFILEDHHAECREVIDNCARILINLMSHQVQSSDIVRNITSKEFSTGDRVLDLSNLFHTMMESLNFDHYVLKIINSIYRRDLNDLFLKKMCLKVFVYFIFTLSRFLYKFYLNKNRDLAKGYRFVKRVVTGE